MSSLFHFIKVHAEIFLSTKFFLLLKHVSGGKKYAHQNFIMHFCSVMMKFQEGNKIANALQTNVFINLVMWLGYLEETCMSEFFLFDWLIFLGSESNGSISIWTWKWKCSVVENEVNKIFLGLIVVRLLRPSSRCGTDLRTKN